MKSAIGQLLTATRDHGSWKPGIVISYLGPDIAHSEGWYISLTEFRMDRNNASGPPAKSIIFKGKFETLREALKAVAEFLAPTKLDEMKSRVQALAEKL